jgi:hypothetical protein
VNDPTLASQTLYLQLQSSQSQISFGHMIAPSPDFFTGSSSELCVDGYWVERTVIATWPYDAGCDSGRTFITDNIVTDPQEPITAFQYINGDLFRGADGVVHPVATWTISLAGPSA